ARFQEKHLDGEEAGEVEVGRDHGGEILGFLSDRGRHGSWGDAAVENSAPVLIFDDGVMDDLPVDTPRDNDGDLPFKGNDSFQHEAESASAKLLKGLRGLRGVRDPDLAFSVVPASRGLEDGRDAQVFQSGLKGGEAL